MESEDSKIKEGGGAWVRRRLTRRVGVGNGGVRERKVRKGPGRLGEGEENEDEKQIMISSHIFRAFCDALSSTPYSSPSL